MKKLTRSSKVALVFTLALLSAGFTCSKGTKQLATASNVIAHSLANARTAVDQGAAQGIVEQADADVFRAQLVRVAQAGQTLDRGIRANEAATTLSPKVNSFLDAFNELNTQGLAGIKNANLKLTISGFITTAEASVAIIAASVGK